ncbi:hypothetical protein LTR66_007554 [Elasticomyces elasticus]|nr:hypothetical protein LTR66_007554 [Elasticomyces elasticus]
MAPVCDSNTHRTAYTATDPSVLRPLKVSGSAYKLTRGRALHHGTCLLTSPNLNIIPDYLHSPAKPYIRARGVESVSSPVGNIGVSTTEFTKAVQQEFASMYHREADLDAQEVGDDQFEVASIRKGYQELKSLEWTYLQTPQFMFSTDLSDQDKGDSAAPGYAEPRQAHAKFTVRYGVITEADVRETTCQAPTESMDTVVSKLQGCKLHSIHDWEDAISASSQSMVSLASWLKRMLPAIH